MLDIRVIPITRHWICGERQISLALLRAQFLMLLTFTFLFRIVTFIQIFGHTSAHGVAGNTYRVRLENVENSFCVVNNSGGRKHSLCGSCVN